MPDQVRLAWQEKRIAQEVMLPLVRIRTPKADRVFGFVYPGVGEILSGGFFDEDAFFDEELFFDEGGVVLDEGARLLEISPLRNPTGRSTPRSWARSGKPNGVWSSSALITPIRRSRSGWARSTC